MYDINEVLNNKRESAYKKGYTIDDKEEIKMVYNTIQSLHMPNNNFIAQLQGLFLVKDQTIDNTSAGYNIKTNTITYQNDEDLVHELFHVASTSNGSKTTGIVVADEEESKSNYGLNEGITSMFAHMSKSDISCGYPFEKMCAESLGYLFGYDIFKGYFNNSYDEFISLFPEEVQVDIVDIIYNLDEYNDISKSIYTGNTVFSVQDLEDITKFILRGILSVSEFSDKEESELIDFFRTKAEEPSIQPIRELIKLDNVIDSIEPKNL